MDVYLKEKNGAKMVNTVLQIWTEIEWCLNKSYKLSEFQIRTRGDRLFIYLSDLSLHPHTHPLYCARLSA